jgi:hypothetical protein
VASRSEEMSSAVEDILAGTGCWIERFRVATPLPTAEPGWRARVLREIRDSEELRALHDLWDDMASAFSKMALEGYFERDFPGTAIEGFHGQAFTSALDRGLGCGNSLGESDMSSTDTRRLVEFLYAHTPKRYDYTVRVNSVLKSHDVPYRLVKGRLLRKGSEVLESGVLSVEHNTSDQHLLKLIRSATEAFLDRSGNRKWEGLRTIVDAFERAKTIADPNKKRSIRTIITNIDPSPDVQEDLDRLLSSLTGLANTYTIRHHEINKVTLVDQDMIDFLFYVFYNAVTLMLAKAPSP